MTPVEKHRNPRPPDRHALIPFEFPSPAPESPGPEPPIHLLPLNPPTSLEDIYAIFGLYPPGTIYMPPDIDSPPHRIPNVPIFVPSSATIRRPAITPAEAHQYAHERWNADQEERSTLRWWIPMHRLRIRDEERELHELEADHRRLVSHPSQQSNHIDQNPALIRRRIDWRRAIIARLQEQIAAARAYLDTSRRRFAEATGVAPPPDPPVYPDVDDPEAESSNLPAHADPGTWSSIFGYTDFQQPTGGNAQQPPARGNAQQPPARGNVEQQPARGNPEQQPARGNLQQRGSAQQGASSAQQGVNGRQGGGSQQQPARVNSPQGLNGQQQPVRGNGQQGGGGQTGGNGQPQPARANRQQGGNGRQGGNGPQGGGRQGGGGQQGGGSQAREASSQARGW